MDAEKKRLQEIRDSGTPWKKWGPYLSERQWGTVREDYSENGNAWDYFPHDHARSRAYHWGEDGLAGISDEKQRLCFALALWNGRDPILKERLFGLTNSEGNHGEDVKEYYFYLDNTPTHSYMRYLYKYPQSAYPYDDLVKTNRHCSRTDLEYELLDNGVFDDNRYFDIQVEYAKAAPEDILIRISVTNCSEQSSKVHLLPTLWYRNSWSWWQDISKPILEEITKERYGRLIIRACDPQGDTCFLHCPDGVKLLFTENGTNQERLFGKTNLTPYVKDGINDCVVGGKTGKQNILVINKIVHKVLSDHLKESKLSVDDFLFKSKKGDHPLTIQAVNSYVKKWTAAINLKGNYGAHSLRKTWGYIQRTHYGVGFEVICKRFNHQSPAVTMRYLGITDKEVANILTNNEIG